MRPNGDQRGDDLVAPGPRIARAPRFAVYAGVGCLLALGAPLGWLALRWLGGASIRSELAAHAGLYGYLLLGSAIAFTLFGALLGRVDDRLVESNRRLAQLSWTDALTGLANLRRFRSRLAHELARTQRSGHALSLILIDLDGFKAINDQHGHAAGDAVLIHAARTLAASMRQIDEVCRIGGDEFAVICPDTPIEGARTLAERARAALEGDPFSRELRVTGSFGLAEGANDAETLYAHADAALYTAKMSGRNRVCGSQEPRGGGAARAAEAART